MKQSIHDYILEPIEIGEIILTIEANGDKPTDENIIKVFKMLMKIRHDDAVHTMSKSLEFIKQGFQYETEEE